MDFGQKIAHRIRELRKSKGITQEKLAEKVDMDLTAFSRIERGSNTNIQVNTLDRIIQALEIDYLSFFSVSSDDNPKHRLNAKPALLEDQDPILEHLEGILDWKVDN
ncbi:helix-turn-helix domain-containing protein [Streptococcus caprae]|uniref:Helix-turn-helix domain-containing protein n=1 Tax=Streptococcus caprae TaxID=1640501 RepID=A0ABV8CU65_9STRE